MATEHVDDFVYLGATEKDFNFRKAKAWAACHRLKGILVESIRTLTSSDLSTTSHMLKYHNGGLDHFWAWKECLCQRRRRHQRVFGAFFFFGKDILSMPRSDQVLQCPYWGVVKKDGSSAPALSGSHLSVYLDQRRRCNVCKSDKKTFIGCSASGCFSLGSKVNPEAGKSVFSAMGHIWPAVLKGPFYGAETWTLTSTLEKRLDGC
eukprot:sb/3470433/